MKHASFKEWIGKRVLLSELSPDLLHRAGEEGERRSKGGMYPYEAKRARRFRSAARNAFGLDLDVVPDDDEVRAKRSYPMQVVQIDPIMDDDGELSGIFKVGVKQMLAKREEIGDYGYYPMGGELEFDANTGSLTGGWPRMSFKLEPESGEKLVARINSIYGTDYRWKG